MVKRQIKHRMRDEVWGSNDGTTWVPVYSETASEYKYLRLTADDGSETVTIPVPDWLRSCPRSKQ